MKKNEARQRWKDPVFLAALDPRLEHVFADGAHVRNVRFEGINIGSKSPLGLFYAGLYKKEITDSDFSFATFECAFSESIITKTSFRDCSFESTSFQKSRVSRCVFSGASFKGGGCNDSVFEECDFTKTTLRDKPGLALSFLRSRFFRCDFTDSTINGAEFRAATFEECNFNGAKFLNCDLRGVKFFGKHPGEDEIGRGSGGHLTFWTFSSPHLGSPGCGTVFVPISPLPRSFAGVD